MNISIENNNKFEEEKINILSNNTLYNYSPFHIDNDVNNVYLDPAEGKCLSSQSSNKSLPNLNENKPYSFLPKPPPLPKPPETTPIGKHRLFFRSPVQSPIALTGNFFK